MPYNIQHILVYDMCIYVHGTGSRASITDQVHGNRAGATNKCEYIYIYRERERERETERYTCVYTCVCLSLSLSTYIYIYIYTFMYIYIERERYSKLKVCGKRPR